MTEIHIIKWLYERFSVQRAYKYQLHNTYVFGWESDFLFFTRRGYAYEAEIKTNRADFFADFNKKEKHRILAANKPYSRSIGMKNASTIGNRTYSARALGYKRQTYLCNNITWVDIDKRPNKFFYVVPEGLIGEDEVPEYAGLMYYGQKEFIKKPPFIHKEVRNYDKILLDKFYYITINTIRNEQ